MRKVEEYVLNKDEFNELLDVIGMNRERLNTVANRLLYGDGNKEAIADWLHAMENELKEVETKLEEIK